MFRVSPAFICPKSKIRMLITGTGASEPYRQMGIEVSRA
jgi:hypothetical protein